MGGTIRVGATSHLEASGLGISSESALAHTQRAMQLHIAFSVLAANIALCTRVHAALVKAGLVICAFVVGLALGSRSHVYGRVFDATDTFRVRGTIVVGRARTNGLVIDGTANGAHTAGVDARITAALVVARAITGTV